MDKLVEHNANIVDIEMGLPAFRKVKDGKELQVAPRMDIVTLEARDLHKAVVFWEAKLMSNPELRRRGDAEPRIVGQLRDYRQWVESGQQAIVGKAYKDNCLLLVRFHNMAKRTNDGIGELGDEIRSIASSASTPEVDPQPRIVVHDAKTSSSWAAHKAKLSKFHLQVVRTEAKNDMILRPNSG